MRVAMTVGGVRAIELTLQSLKSESLYLILMLMLMLIFVISSIQGNDLNHFSRFLFLFFSPSTHNIPLRHLYPPPTGPAFSICPLAHS